MKAKPKTTKAILWGLAIFFCLFSSFVYPSGAYAAANASPKAGTITPSSGSSAVNQAVNFTTTYSDTNGWQDIQYVFLLINTSTNGQNCFYGYYNQNTNKLYLRNDANTAWIGGFAPGTDNTIENSYARLHCLGTDVLHSDTELTVKWKASFKDSFAGKKNTYLRLIDNAGANTGLVKKGSWTINRPPVLDPIGDKQIEKDKLLEFTVSATDPDNDPLTYKAANLPQGASFNETTHKFTWTPDYTQAGTYSNVKFTVSDGTLEDSESIMITVTNVNRAPELAPVGNKATNENQKLEFTISATDPDLDTLTYSASDLPSGSAFNATTKTFTWTPDYTQAGTYSNVKFTVSDGTLEDSETIIITVIDVDITPPTGTIIINNDDTYTTKTAVTLTLSATDSGSGVDKMQFSNDNSNWSGPQAYATSKTWTLTDGDAEKTVYAKFSDKAGNWTAAEIKDTITLILDTVPPRVYPVACVIDKNSLKITYNEKVNGATDPANYSITPSLGTITISDEGNNVYLLTTSNEQISQKLYTIRIQNVTDLANNLIHPNYKTVMFLGRRVGVGFLGWTTGPVLPVVSMTGENTYDCFGYSVSSAGDVNGDGHDDVIVGVPYADYNGTNSGKVYIYFGGETMDNTADVTMIGEAAENYFGFPVSSAGDVNGDGYSDVVIGACRNNTNGYDSSKPSGKAYIYFGGKTMDNVADVVMTGEANGDRFGYSVASAGDVNGDGHDDVIIGAHVMSVTIGKAYIYFGGETMDNVADINMTGNFGWDYFGYSVSSAGDVNGDGYSDVIVGSPLRWNDGNYGKAFLYFGGETMDSVADVIVTNKDREDWFGDSVSSAGDVNGDGYDDVIIGNHWRGKDYIYFGGKTMDDIADVTVASEGSYGNSTSAGDVNGDGYDDVIVGSPRYGDGDFGKAYIYFGGETMDNAADITITGEAAHDHFGCSVSLAGDVNGDGHDDVIVGANQGYTGVNGSGKAYIFQWVGHMLQPQGGPAVDSFYVSDTNTQSQEYTGSRTVKVEMTELTPQGTITKWLINESSQQPKKEDFILTQRPTTYTITGNEGKVTIYGWVMNDNYEISELADKSQASIILDTTSPTTPAVTDDGSTTTSTVQLHAKWSSSDPESGIVEYQYKIAQDSTSGTTIIDWTSTGASTEVTKTGLSLTIDKTYYFLIKAKNNAGSWSSEGYSDGIKIVDIPPDTTPPTGTITINNGDEYTNSKTVALTLSAADSGSGLDKMRFSNDNSTWSDPQDYSTTKIWALSSGDDEKTVWAKFSDKAGNWSAPVSDSIVLDTTPPSTPVVTDDGKYTSSRTQLHAKWSSEDFESGIAEYKYAIGTQKGSTNIVSWTSRGTSTEVTKTGLDLNLGQTYYFSVKAKNGAQLWSVEGYSDGIIVSTNSSPIINAVLPSADSPFMAGAQIKLQINATDPDADPLEFQFSIAGAIKQPWSGSNSYTWATSSSDTGSVNVLFEVRDDRDGYNSKGLTYTIINPSSEEILQKVSENQSSIEDLKANMTLSTTLDSQPLSAPGYYVYYFKKLDKEKIETYSSSQRTEKTDITIIGSSTMYLVDPVSKEIEQIDLLASSKINQTQFKQMDIYYNLTEFLNSHTVAKNEGDSDFINLIVAIDAVPKTENPVYEKLELFIDYNKGLLIKSLLFKDGSLREKTEIQESQVMPNGAWVPVKMVKTPMLTSGNMVDTLVYSDVQINTGLTDDDFEPTKQ